MLFVFSYFDSKMSEETITVSIRRGVHGVTGYTGTINYYWKLAFAGSSSQKVRNLRISNPEETKTETKT